MTRVAGSLFGVALFACCLVAQDIPILPKVVPGATRIAKIEKQPRRTVEPTYPPEAIKRWIQGTVVLDVVIGKTGEVEMVGFEDHCCATSPTVLARAAADAVRQWIWEPIIVNGKPTRIRTKVAVNFVLDEKSPPMDVCVLVGNPAYYNDRTVNVSGTVKYDSGLKLLVSAGCRGSVVIADQVGTSFVRDKTSPTSACLRGMFQQYNGPRELRVQRLILERILDCPK